MSLCVKYMCANQNRLNVRAYSRSGTKRIGIRISYFEYDKKA